jgi:hypothetical protein
MPNEKPFKLDMLFEEALRRFAQADPEEARDEQEKIARKEEEVEQYVREREDSIRLGARRSKKRFRL